MPNFYDQDNPRGYVADERTATPNMKNVVSENANVKPLREQEMARNCVKKSMKPKLSMEQKIVRQQIKRRERKRRMAALGLTCLLVGGAITMTFQKVSEELDKQATIYGAISDFDSEVIYPNMHRTLDDKNYFYDYDDIAEYLMMPGRDFSTELYKAYLHMGEAQANKILGYTGSGYDSIADFLQQSGYRNADEWGKSEREKILLQAQIDDKQSELAQMQSEQKDSTTLASNAQYQGGNK